MPPNIFYISEFFRDEIMPALQIEGKVVGSMATEDIHLELKKGYEDFNFRHYLCYVLREYQKPHDGVHGGHQYLQGSRNYPAG